MKNIWLSWNWNWNLKEIRAHVYSVLSNASHLMSLCISPSLSLFVSHNFNKSKFTNIVIKLKQKVMIHFQNIEFDEWFVKDHSTKKNNLQSGRIAEHKSTLSTLCNDWSHTFKWHEIKNQNKRNKYIYTYIQLSIVLCIRKRMFSNGRNKVIAMNEQDRKGKWLLHSNQQIHAMKRTSMYKYICLYIYRFRWNKTYREMNL